MAISLPLRAERTLRHLRLRTLVVVAIGSIAVATGLFAGSRSSLFGARAFEVSGASHLSRSEVFRIAGVSGGTNVPWLDEGTVERRLEAEPWVSSAEVSSSLPWTIRIAIVERSPVAVTIQGSVRSLVAEDGTVLGTAGRIDGLPRIEMPIAPALDGPAPTVAGAASALGAMSGALRAEVKRVIVSADGTLELRLAGGMLVRYGAASGQAKKADVIERILTWSGSRGRGVMRISVVAPDVPAMTLAP